MPDAPPPDLPLIRQQREYALACAWLSLTISVALLISNFGRGTRQLDGVRAEIQIHRSLLAQNQEVLRQNQDVLRQTQQALANAEKPATRAKR